MKDNLIFIEKLYNEILDIATTARDVLPSIKVTNIKDLPIKLSITAALLHSIAWIVAFKAARNKEQLHLYDYTQLPEINFTIEDKTNQNLLAITLVVENLYERVTRLNKDLEKVLT